MSNGEANRGDNISALLHSLGVLKTGETRRLITQLGQAASLDAAKTEVTYFRQGEAVDAALEELGTFWKDYLAAVHVETPDMNMNTMLNIHNPRQCYITKTWSRYLSYYQPGLGSRGIGFRDSSQDILGVITSAPGECRDFLHMLLAFQKRDGSAMHQFNPLTLEGSVGDSIEMEDRPHYFSDDHLWGIIAVTAYLKETGDVAFLDEVIPFYDRDKQGDVLESGTVMEHMQRGLDFTHTDTGAHGLPLLGFADWNDTVNLPKGAESLFTANLYGKALQEMIVLMEHLGQIEKAHSHNIAYNEFKDLFNISAWDGRWFIRYLDAKGKPLGSLQNTFGQIYLNGQSWSVISGFASFEYGRRAMDAVYQKSHTTAMA